MEASAPSSQQVGKEARYDGSRRAAVTRSGWVTFAGVMMLIVGTLDVIWGIAAIANNEIVVVGGQGVLVLDVGTWGWIQLVLGAIVALAGLGLLAGSEVARVVAVTLLAFNAVLQVVWFPAAPLWALMIIALDVVIIYQLNNDWVEHGSA